MDSFKGVEKKGKPSRLSDEKAEMIIKELIPVADFKSLVREMESEVFQDDPELLLALARLVLELSDRMLGYDSILSDDTSGRIPSLLLRRLINKKRRDAGIKDSIPTYFIAGGRSLQGWQFGEFAGINNREEVKEFVIEKRGELGRTLVVTEFICSGESIERLATILDDCGVDYDVAAVSVRDEGRAKVAPLLSSGTLIYGAQGWAGENLHSWHTQFMSGVKHGDSPSAHPVAERGEERDMKAIASARRDVDRLADTFSRLLGAR
jgi:hypothetical protein